MSIRLPTMVLKKGEIGKVILLSIFSGIYLFFFLRVLWRVGDEGLVVYGAQLVAEGNLPYRDFFEVFGPGSFYFLAFFFKLFGVSFFVARIVLLITGISIVTLVYIMTRRVYNLSFAMFPAIFYLIIGIPSWPATNHHWDSILFALLAVAFFFLWQDKHKMRYLFLSGILSGVTTCIIQQKGILLIIAFIIIIIINGLWKGNKRKIILMQLGALLIGFSFIGLSVIIYFYLNRGLQEIIYANIVWPIKYYSFINVVPYGYGLFEFYLKGWSSLFSSLFPAGVCRVFEAIIITPYLFVLLLPGLLLIGIVGLLWSGSDWWELFRPNLLPYWICGLALFVSELQRMDILHLIYGSPLLIILTLVIQKKLFENHKIFYNIGLAILFFCLIFLGTFRLAVAISTKPMNTRRGTVYLIKTDEALEFINKKTKPGENVFIYPYYAMYYFLADINNPTSYNNLLYQYHTQEQFIDAIEDIEKKKVKYILWDTKLEKQNLRKWFPRYKMMHKEDLLMENYLESHYEMIDILNGFRVLKRKDIPTKQEIMQTEKLPDPGEDETRH